MPSPQKSERILIVEDDNLVARHIALRLEELGYGVAGILARGEAALQQIEQMKTGLTLPDLILMDIKLAGRIDGIEAARLIQLKANIPVVILTAYTDQELVKRALTTRPFAYLQIPLKDRELELTLELVLLRHRMEGKSRLTQQALEQRVAESSQALASTNQALQQLTNQRHRDQSSVQRFSDLLDVSADSIYLIDVTGMRFIDVNQTACAISGYSRDELLALGPQDIKPYFNRHMLEQEFSNIAATPDRFGIINTFHKNKNGRIYPVEIRLRATAAEGRAIVVAIARDMSLREQNEQALRQSEERFSQITQNIQQVLWMRDIETEQVVYISSAYEKIWGRSVTQVYRRPRMLFADIHPLDRERFSNTVQNMWKSKYDLDEEYRLLRGDGQICWLRTRTFPIRNDKGIVYRIGGVTEDITAHKEDEEKIHLSDEKFRLLFESSPIGLCLVTRDYRLAEVNPSFCNMLSYSQEELTGKTLNDITHPDDLNISLKNIDKLFSGEVTGYSREKRYLRKNGEILWCRLHSATILDQQQRPLFGLGMVEDIDQIKKAETLRLAREAAQKNALVREVHHRIKNHLQGVVGLMRQSTQHIQNSSQFSSIIEEAITQINMVATIHGLQGKETGEDIDLLQMLTAISDSLNEFNPARFVSPLKVTGSVALTLNRDESVPIALALNELMVNAAKHGSSPMQISLQCSDDCAIICIENQSSQTMGQLHPGSGLELVHALLHTEGVAFSYEHINQHFLAKIVLTPPVIQLRRTTE